VKARIDLHFSGGSMRVPMEGSFYAGIGVCAHNKDASVTTFDPALIVGAPLLLASLALLACYVPA
jgi:hypothetical protein